MIYVAADMELRGVKLKDAQLELIAKFFDAEHEAFIKMATVVHRKSVFQILIRIIRLCNVETGRLRASFTPLMDKYGWTSYVKYMQAAQLEGGDTTRLPHNEAALREGKSLGTFVDAILNTTIGSNVVYAEAVNARSQFLIKALIWGDKQYGQNFNGMFEAAYKKGWIQAEDLAQVREE